MTESSSKASHGLSLALGQAFILSLPLHSSKARGQPDTRQPGRPGGAAREPSRQRARPAFPNTNPDLSIICKWMIRVIL